MATACQIFYRAILDDTKSGDDALKAMNDAIDPAKRTFFPMNAEIAFKSVYREYLKRSTSEAVSKRVDKLLIQAHQHAFMNRGHVLAGPEIEGTRSFLTRHISAHEQHFNKFRREYFLIDRFPENDQRFPITFADCEQSA